MIIVIAIMAILIGVIALAVIPNIQRSRESKDLTTLDGVLSGINVAIANTATSIGDTYATATTVDTLISDDVLGPKFVESYGNKAPKLSSGVVKSDDKKVYFTVVQGTGDASNTYVITVYGLGTDGDVAVCNYTSSDTETDGKQRLKVTNG